MNIVELTGKQRKRNEFCMRTGMMDDGFNTLSLYFLKLKISTNIITLTYKLTKKLK